MKCIHCGNKYRTKGVWRCPNISPRTCERCSFEGKGEHSCSLDCRGTLFPAIKTYPLSSSVVGWTPTGETRGTTEEFLPRTFHFVSCDVLEINQRLTDMHTLEISCQFVLNGNPDLTKQLYRQEGWKLTHIKDAVKEGGRKIDFLPTPTFIVFPSSYARVVPDSVSLKIDGKIAPFFQNDTTDFVGLPDCYPPLTENPKPAIEKHSYLVGKATAFYTPFILGKIYELKFRFEELNFFYSPGFLFPFRFVSFGRFSFDTDEPFHIAARRIRLVRSHRADFFPMKQEYEFLKHVSHELMRPAITPAEPFRNQPLLGDFEKGRFVSQSETLNLLVEGYAALQTRFLIAVPKGKELLTRVQVTQSPLPVRIYEQLQSLPRYRDFLISFDIVNFDKMPQKVEVISEVNGYTDKAITTIDIPARGNGKGKPSRAVFNQCPRLKRGMLEKIVRQVEATLTYKIFRIRGAKRVLYEQNTTSVTLLPKDQMIWVIDDLKSGSRFDLSKMLGAWITSTDRKGILDKIRGGARKYHPQGVLEGEQGNTTLEEKTLQVKALYDYLNDKSGIGYVNQPFRFGVPGQRVLTPEDVIKSKAGNCIDLVVLFSSLMEGLGINPLILLLPDHAFIGWGNKYKTSEMGFLECTTLGAVNTKTGKKTTFEESFELAEKTYKDRFLYIGAEDYLPIHSAFMGSERGFMVDLEEVRKEGIFRI